MRYVLVRHAIPVGYLEPDQPEGEAVSGTVTLRLGAEDIYTITALAHEATRNLGYLGGVTEAGDARGRAAIQAWHALQQELELYTLDGALVAEQVEFLVPMDRTGTQLHLVAHRSSPGNGGAPVPAKRVVPPVSHGASARPDV